ncbi:5'-nucleotidase [Pseudomonas sp. 10B238]|jgi:5'-nucleotidase|uniref:bifunctional metallophosphatase/5'-nucleotidase n=1 Tax=Pseudomonadaceae TaxID=135621 RepID=UPI000617B5E2|nr:MULTISPECIES: bifunctional metallophosphatase/5'-nucleotidase [Pseudomonadaceae]MAL36553.1 bifunctional metallophosphatase/5'-nucleotidase [Pseudomonas sp.]MBU0950653.1 bifunctional metallophosphatase/5'-nucleotidase [Gammaproteobacteria bacterium]KJJ62444.1 5'-nucleotidase [Pseudomonas sp. 10B238]MBK3794287.1 bifunctional metallophosphatase/5'-nucleotidase [Stutzerimonas stutzeri]MBK3875777.1 bifunctional metallophosphatase/5'-nucleotidase [Stutzerimonas stutzeri]
MHTRALDWLLAASLIGLAGPALAQAQALPEHGSIEQDYREQQLEGLSARQRASERRSWRAPDWRVEPVVSVNLLSINDFHGQLSPRNVAGRPAGGAAVLASYLKSASGEYTLIVHDGDQVGASPPNSALLRDEPSISFFNLLANPHCRPFSRQLDMPRNAQPFAQQRCNLIGTLGNHEFDNGRTELLRQLTGGNHAKGPFLEDQWKGARYPTVSSNVIDRATGEPLLPPYSIYYTGGVRIGVIGAVLKETPTIVSPSGVAGLRFVDEADAINQSVAELRRHGVRAIVVALHQGGRQTSYDGPTNPEADTVTGPVVDIIERLDDEVDVVISGHAHGFTNALVPNANGKPILVTQAFSAGTAYADIQLQVSRRSRDIVEKSAAVMTTWADQGAGLSPDPQVAALVAQADARVEPLVARVVGLAQNGLTRTETPAGESALGNLIADAQRVATDAQISFMNPGGIRADLDSGEVTWGELFAIQPFANDLVSMDLTGAQIKTLLEQQWLGQSYARLLKPSGIQYSWSASRPVGNRVIEMRDATGALINPAATYRVTVNSFLAGGGDNFTVLTEGKNRVVGPVDLDALVDYIEALPQPFTAAVEGRIQRVD